MDRWRETVTKMRSRWTLGSAATLIIGLIVTSIWFVKTMPDSDGYVLHERSAASAYDPADDPEFDQPKSCPQSDPCARTKAHWVSPQRMRDRFQAGRLGNARGKTIPLNVKRMLTKKWNEDHGVPGRATGKGLWDCGGHWWCGSLEVGTCVVSYFLCVGETMGYDQATSVTIHCGGTAFILVRTGAPPTAAGIGGGLCIYNDIGRDWGWW